MDELETTGKLINWDGNLFSITDEHELKVIVDDDEFGRHDMDSWIDAMLDGPIADVRRSNENLVGSSRVHRVDTIKLMEEMIIRARGKFIWPLVELETYAKNYQTDGTHPTLF